MKNNKSPGPDGFNVEFFLATWNITGTSFSGAVQSLFLHCHMHKGINLTNIVLIPKLSVSTTIKDFRPIALCTVAYKCISKIMASRLKTVFTHVVDIFQSAFIPGRHIFRQYFTCTKTQSRS